LPDYSPATPGGSTPDAERGSPGHDAARRPPHRRAVDDGQWAPPTDPFSPVRSRSRPAGGADGAQGQSGPDRPSRHRAFAGAAQGRQREMSPAARGRLSPITRPRRASGPWQTSADKNFSAVARGYLSWSEFGYCLHNASNDDIYLLPLNAYDSSRPSSRNGATNAAPAWRW
jgi:hypothetical protein